MGVPLTLKFGILTDLINDLVLFLGETLTPSDQDVAFDPCGGGTFGEHSVTFACEPQEDNLGDIHVKILSK